MSLPRETGLGKSWSIGSQFSGLASVVDPTPSTLIPNPIAAASETGAGTLTGWLDTGANTNAYGRSITPAGAWYFDFAQQADGTFMRLRAENSTVVSLSRIGQAAIVQTDMYSDTVRNSDGNMDMQVEMSASGFSLSQSGVVRYGLSWAAIAAALAGQGYSDFAVNTHTIRVGNDAGSYAHTYRGLVDPKTTILSVTPDPSGDFTQTIALRYSGSPDLHVGEVWTNDGASSVKLLGPQPLTLLDNPSAGLADYHTPASLALTNLNPSQRGRNKQLIVYPNNNSDPDFRKSAVVDYPEPLRIFPNFMALDGFSNIMSPFANLALNYCQCINDPTYSNGNATHTIAPNVMTTGEWIGSSTVVCWINLPADPNNWVHIRSSRYRGTAPQYHFGGGNVSCSAVQQVEPGHWKCKLTFDPHDPALRALCGFFFPDANMTTNYVENLDIREDGVPLDAFWSQAFIDTHACYATSDGSRVPMRMLHSNNPASHGALSSLPPFARSWAGRTPVSATAADGSANGQILGPPGAERVQAWPYDWQIGVPLACGMDVWTNLYPWQDDEFYAEWAAFVAPLLPANSPLYIEVANEPTNDQWIAFQSMGDYGNDAPPFGNGPPFHHDHIEPVCIGYAKRTAEIAAMLIPVFAAHGITRDRLVFWANLKNGQTYEWLSFKTQIQSMNAFDKVDGVCQAPYWTADWTGLAPYTDHDAMKQAYVDGAKGVIDLTKQMFDVVHGDGKRAACYEFNFSNSATLRIPGNTGLTSAEIIAFQASPQGQAAWREAIRYAKQKLGGLMGIWAHDTFASGFGSMIGPAGPNGNLDEVALVQQGA